MDIQIGSWLEAVESAFGFLPSAIIAAVLLGGPTAVWLLYRFVVQPRSSRYRSTDATAGIMWVCPSCRSINELRSDRCYRCDRIPLEDELHVIDPVRGLPIPLELPVPSATTGIPVGPGRLEVEPLPGLTGMTGMTDLNGLRGVTASKTRPPVPDDREPIPVAPARPRTSQPRRAVMASRPRPVGTGPDDPSAA